MKFFEFTKTDFEHIVNECMLDEEYSKILEYKIKGYSRTKIADMLGMATDTLDKKIAKLKKKIKKIL